MKTDATQHHPPIIAPDGDMSAYGWECVEIVPTTLPKVDSAAMEFIETLRQYGAEFPDLPMALAVAEDFLAAAARPVQSNTITAAPVLAHAAAAILGPILADDPTPAQAGVRAFCLANLLAIRPPQTQRQLAAELGVSPGTVGEAASKVAIIKRP